jgi:hypothetical protein
VKDDSDSEDEVVDAEADADAAEAAAGQGAEAMAAAMNLPAGQAQAPAAGIDDFDPNNPYGIGAGRRRRHRRKHGGLRKETAKEKFMAILLKHPQTKYPHDTDEQYWEYIGTLLEDKGIIPRETSWEEVKTQAEKLQAEMLSATGGCADCDDSPSGGRKKKSSR